jgi:hypothetical protein
VHGIVSRIANFATADILGSKIEKKAFGAFHSLLRVNVFVECV